MACVLSGARSAKGITTTDLQFRYLELRDCRFFEKACLWWCKRGGFAIEGSKFIRNEYSETFGLDFEGKDSFVDFVVSGCEFLDNSRSAEKFGHVDSLLHEHSVVQFPRSIPTTYSFKIVCSIARFCLAIFRPTEVLFTKTIISIVN